MKKMKGDVMKKVTDKEYMKRLLQDLKVKERDMDDFIEKKKLRKIIEKFEQGIETEYSKKSYSS
jgi:hypothetical protein